MNSNVRFKKLSNLFSPSSFVIRTEGKFEKRSIATKRNIFTPLSSKIGPAKWTLEIRCDFHAQVRILLAAP